MRLEEVLNRLEFKEEIIEKILSYEIKGKEYVLNKNLYYDDFESFLKNLDVKKDKDIFSLKFYALLLLDKKEDYKYSEEIFFDTFKDLKIWQERYFKDENKIGIKEHRFINKLFLERVIRLGSLEFELKIFDITSFKEKNITYEIFTDIKSRELLKNIEKEIVLNIHIPEGANLDLKSIRHSFNLAKKIFKDIRYYVCHSWLISPKLQELLGADSKINIFYKNFHIFAISYDFNQAKQRVLDFKEKRESSLSRKLKKYIEEVGNPGMGYGIIDLG